MAVGHRWAVAAAGGAAAVPVADDVPHKLAGCGELVLAPAAGDAGAGYECGGALLFVI